MKDKQNIANKLLAGASDLQHNKLQYTALLDHKRRLCKTKIVKSPSQLWPKWEGRTGHIKPLKKMALLSPLQSGHLTTIKSDIRYSSLGGKLKEERNIRASQSLLNIKMLSSVQLLINFC